MIMHRRTVPLAAAGVILVLDAVVGLVLGGLFLIAAQWWVVVGEDGSRWDLVVFYLLPLLVCGAAALGGPAAATLVVTVRRRWARVVAGAGSGVLVVAASAQAAVWASLDLTGALDDLAGGNEAGADRFAAIVDAGIGLMVVVGLVNLIAIVLLIGPADTEGDVPWNAPADFPHSEAHDDGAPSVPSDHDSADGGGPGGGRLRVRTA
jgi:hypothetical protein